ILEFDPQGNFIQGFVPGESVISLAFLPHSSTLLYNQDVQDIKAVNVATGQPLPNFTTGTLLTAVSLGVLADGRELAVEDTDVALLDQSGHIVHKYSAFGLTTWMSLALDSSGTSFWAGDFLTGKVAEFDIATGNVLQSFDTKRELAGLAMGKAEKT